MKNGIRAKNYDKSIWAEEIWSIDGDRDGVWHRTDGPAIIHTTNKRAGEVYWYINGNECRSNKQYQSLTGVSDEDMAMLILKYGDIN